MGSFNDCCVGWSSRCDVYERVTQVSVQVRFAVDIVVKSLLGVFAESIPYRLNKFPLTLAVRDDEVQR